MYAQRFPRLTRNEPVKQNPALRRPRTGAWPAAGDGLAGPR
jgi:hypothetical protein